MRYFTINKKTNILTRPHSTQHSRDTINNYNDFINIFLSYFKFQYIKIKLCINLICLIMAVPFVNCNTLNNNYVYI